MKRIIVILISALFVTSIKGQSYPDIDIEAVLADSVSIYGIEPRVQADVALPECARRTRTFSGCQVVNRSRWRVL